MSNNSRQAKYYAKNKELCKERTKKWAKENPKKFKIHLRQQLLRSKYNLSLKEYNILLQKQKGLCAICRLPERAFLKNTLKSLAVDHNHYTDAVRGLLCSKCNLGLGQFNDSILMLKKAITYLKRFI